MKKLLYAMLGDEFDVLAISLACPQWSVLLRGQWRFGRIEVVDAGIDQ